MEDKIRAIIAEELNIAIEKVIPGASLERNLHIDSLDIIDIVVALEEEFDIDIRDKDVEKWVTVADVVKCVKEYK